MRAKPATISYTTPGTGSIQHLSMELLAWLSGARFVHVPYRSGALALNDTLAGHVPLSVLSVVNCTAAGIPASWESSSSSLVPTLASRLSASGLAPGASRE